MPGNDQQSWNQRYLAGEFQNREPDAFVRMAHREYLLPLLRRNTAPDALAGLDLCGGAGRHAIWLAQQGWRMTLADWSEVALEIAKNNASEQPGSLSIEIVQGAALEIVTRLHREGRRFGFALVSFFLDRAFLPWLPKILVPGGLLLYRTYNQDNERLGNPRGPRNPEFLLRPQELLDVYRCMTLFHYNETAVAKGVTELIAQQSTSEKFLRLL